MKEYILNLTKEVDRSFKLNEACTIISEYWESLEANSEIIINLDFKNVEFIDPTSAALLLHAMDYFPRRIILRNVPPRVDGIFKRIGGKIPPKTIFAARRIKNSFNPSILDDLKLYVSDIFNRFYDAPKNSSADFVEFTTVELINNINDHSNAPNGGIIVGASFKSRKHFELSVIDFGNTIPGTLEHLFPQMNDEELITKALEFGVSRRYGSEQNYGRGLEIVKSYSMQDKDCSLQVVSRNGFVSITNKQLHVRKSNYNFPGTLVKCCYSEAFVKQHVEFSNELEELEM